MPNNDYSLNGIKVWKYFKALSMIRLIATKDRWQMWFFFILFFFFSKRNRIIRIVRLNGNTCACYVNYYHAFRLYIYNFVIVNYFAVNMQAFPSDHATWKSTRFHLHEKIQRIIRSVNEYFFSNKKLIIIIETTCNVNIGVNKYYTHTKSEKYYCEFKM